MSSDPPPPPGVDPTKTSLARAYDYTLGGKDNYEVDRKWVDWFFEVAPDTPLSARENRAFGKRAARYMAEQGIKQFLDLGSGIPTTPPSVHEAVRAVDPSIRVVYVDNDPMVVAHSRALRSIEPGLTTILADVRDPEKIFNHPDVQDLIDFSEPVGVLMLALFHMIPDSDNPLKIAEAFRERFAPGSYAAISHFWTESHPDAIAHLQMILAQADAGMYFRTTEEVRQFIDGFELVEPGMGDIRDWRPEQDTPDVRMKLVGGVGRLSG